MVQNNKVLTVSYGTFSCTLEGFDDSFETMKAIAEYFRDLAADDRYFGSEPPQPDTEMLTRIAQRDASRKVEARQSDAGLLIRATEDANVPSQPDVSTPSLNTIDTPPLSQPVFTNVEAVKDNSAPAADSIAAKLQRIRAVVSHSEENSVIYTEDEDTTLMKNTGPSDAVAAAFAAGSLDPSDLETTVEVAPPSETQDDTPEVTEAEAEVPQPEETETLVLESEPEDASSETVDVAAEELSDEEDTLDALFSDLEFPAENAPEEVTPILDDAEPEDETVAAADEGILTEEDEVDLLEEISSVEAVLAKRAAKADDEGSDLDRDVSRLMDKASEQLNDPDTSNQREAYTHLRAAVAVTEAERGDQKATSLDNEEQGYRGDLSSVVSPRRPEVQEATSTRPSSDDAAPLKLVAEQRVDNLTEDAGPVTPRRVKSEAEDDSPEEGGFALFAQEQGAQSLPDLLEAAAAYLSFIEGQEQFSRPQLMNKIRSLKQNEFNREESLRTFGQLLRDGKIEKAGGGRFAASTEIGFRPDDERAAG
ncbi:hypothetical protein RUE5091_01118 [Ruegeria denitrificans]|uniref:Lipoprotein n=1 Tax=Ruegeria denitrificans TaxID=1715692 RepID=A0A0P1I5T6_9RHOB|nr:hypothetical protein [Ruegeria denitrificans]CUJ91592.1 hypothetical protein RUE5091_01118 [Ruegeria denitrificans]